MEKSKCIISDITDLIPTGHENAIGHELLTDKCIHWGLIDFRAKDPDRCMRKLLHDAKLTNVIINLQDGRGYFKPSEKDEGALAWYIAQEKNRVKNASRPLRYAERLYANMKAGRLHNGE